jgi:hypothetical protein
MAQDTSGHGWPGHLSAMDAAVATGDAGAAVRAWRGAYAAALEHPGWQGLVEVAAAALRMGAIGGLARAAEGRARETYWIALFRARQQASLNGVLDAAGAFGELGDHAMVEQCIRVAESLAALEGDGGTADRVRRIAQDLAGRYLTVR